VREDRKERRQKGRNVLRFLHVLYDAGDSDQLYTREWEPHAIWQAGRPNGFLMYPKHYDLVNYNHTLYPVGLCGVGVGNGGEK
jgi:hypothetical protein